MEQENISPKSRLIVLLLCLFVGWLGAHRFYVGKKGTGILMCLLGICSLSGWVLAIPWVLIDLVFIVCGSFRDKEGKLVVKWEESHSA